MDRRLLIIFACLTPLGHGRALDAAEPAAGFSWEVQGPALPSPKRKQPEPPKPLAGPPRYDETYPPLGNASPVPSAASQPVAEPARSTAAVDLGPRYSPQPIQEHVGLTPRRSPEQIELTPRRPPERAASQGLSAAARQTELHIKRGTELGNRRAFYSARAEFVQALRVMAQARDVEYRTDGHSQALAAGLKALDESDDYIARGNAFESELNVARISAVHRTPVVRSDPEGITPREAIQRYYTYAQEQLATSMGLDTMGSAALTAMGKFYGVLAQEQPGEAVTAQAKAMALHQAALVVDANNAVAANELGVLLARFGRPKDAQAWLEHSASIAPQAITWHNLAVVHQQLGDVNLAEQARRQEAALAQRNGRSATSSLPEIRWVSPRELDAVRVDRPTAPAAVRPAPPSRPPVSMRTANLPGESVVRQPGIRAPGAAAFD
jgi:tetratricopeptide (TPR) repeat protein